MRQFQYENIISRQTCLDGKTLALINQEMDGSYERKNHHEQTIFLFYSILARSYTMGLSFCALKATAGSAITVQYDGADAVVMAMNVK